MQDRLHADPWAISSLHTTKYFRTFVLPYFSPPSSSLASPSAIRSAGGGVYRSSQQPSIVPGYPSTVGRAKQTRPSERASGAACFCILDIAFSGMASMDGMAWPAQAQASPPQQVTSGPAEAKGLRRPLFFFVGCARSKQNCTYLGTLSLTRVVLKHRENVFVFNIRFLDDEKE